MFKSKKTHIAGPNLFKKFENQISIITKANSLHFFSFFLLKFFPPGSTAKGKILKKILLKSHVTLSLALIFTGAQLETLFTTATFLKAVNVFFSWLQIIRKFDLSPRYWVQQHFC